MHLPSLVKFSRFSKEEQRRRKLLLVCMSVIIPLSAAFGVVYAMEKRFWGSALIFSVVASLSVNLVLIMVRESMVGLFRLATVNVFVLFNFLVATGAGSGLAWVWAFVLPPIVVLVFGMHEGLFWVAFQLVAIDFLMLGPLDTYHYSLEVVARFNAIYVILGLVAYALESSRERYYNQMLREKVELEGALAEVNTLSGLLPICASCKKIRDDQGYWNQIESYIQAHSDAEFSHGICPDCAQRLYPEISLPDGEKNPG